MRSFQAEAEAEKFAIFESWVLIVGVTTLALIVICVAHTLVWLVSRRPSGTITQQSSK